MLIEQTYDLIFENNKSSSKSNTPTEASERTKPTAGTVKQKKTTQEFLNNIIDQLNVLLAEIITDENDFSRFDTVKSKLRELFIQLEKKDSYVRK
jgi:hypothetical protein